MGPQKPSKPETTMSKVSSETLKGAIAKLLERSAKAKRGFTETVELQIGLKNYDPQKDKRFSGQYKLPNPCKEKIKVCILGDEVHCDEAKKNGLDYKDVETLKNMNKQKKIIKKMARKYNAFLASDVILKQIPRLLGPHLNKAGKFPTLLSKQDKMQDKIMGIQSTVKFQMKKVLCLGVAVGHVKLTPEQLQINLQYAINFLVSLLKKGWQNVRTLYIKTSM